MQHNVGNSVSFKADLLEDGKVRGFLLFFSYRFSLSLLKFNYICGYLYIYLSTHTHKTSL